MLRRMTVTSLALVPTDRPARYGKQLASHLGRRSVSTWDDETASGTITFDNGLLAMASAADELSLTLETDGGSVEQTHPQLLQQPSDPRDVVGEGTGRLVRAHAGIGVLEVGDDRRRLAPPPRIRLVGFESHLDGPEVARQP